MNPKDNTDLRQKVLVLDDEEMNLKSLYRALRNLEADFFQVTDAKEALKLCDENSFSVIISDIVMPNMDGFQFIEKLKESKLNKNSPIIFITGNRFDDDDIFKGYELGAVDYLTKPISNYILKSKVSIFIQLAQKKAELQKALDEVNTLKGFLPICSYCHNIRDDKGYWGKIEKYISEHSQVQFSHGMCPSCMKREFPEIYKEMLEKGEIEEVQ